MNKLPAKLPPKNPKAHKKKALNNSDKGRVSVGTNVLDDIAAISERTDLTEKKRHHLRAKRKATEMVTRLDTLVLPYKFGKVTVTGFHYADKTVTIEGSGGGISWPVHITNPPLLVADKAGAVSRVMKKPDGTTKTLRFRLDPVQALRDILADLVKQAAK